LSSTTTSRPTNTDHRLETVIAQTAVQGMTWLYYVA
jgi:hypothetical protein